MIKYIYSSAAIKNQTEILGWDKLGRDPTTIIPLCGGRKGGVLKLDLWFGINNVYEPWLDKQTKLSKKEVLIKYDCRFCYCIALNVLRTMADQILSNTCHKKIINRKFFKNVLHLLGC